MWKVGSELQSTTPLPDLWDLSYLCDLCPKVVFRVRETALYQKGGPSGAGPALGRRWANFGRPWYQTCFSQDFPRLWECAQRPQQWLEMSRFKEKRVDLGVEYEEVSF